MSAQGSPEPWVYDRKKLLNPEGVRQCEPFQGFNGLFCCCPQGSRCARTAGLKLVNAFGVKIQTDLFFSLDMLQL